MNKVELASQSTDMLLKASPPLAVTGLTLFGVAEDMINMHLDESNKLDFDGFNISVAG